ncbi:MAG: type IV secretory system conjugative DNA transfer family protein, partial [Planctomycetes bacterium]|nr:type IV secretory system conjugative DNA transfer family protein [Planctomycetota bacterium]
MIFFLFALFAVIAIDTIALAIFLDPSFFIATAAISLLAASATVFLYRRNKKIPDLAGWKLGKAIVLNDPNLPTIDNAVISRQAINLGILALGGPGSGKTESIALSLFYSLPEALPGSGLAFFEGKGDIDIYKKACACGRKPDKFFSTELPGSSTLNLMDGEVLDVEDRLTRLLISETTTTSFYSDLQRAVLKFAIPVIKGVGEKVILRDLYTFLTNQNAQTEILLRARESDIDQTMVSMFENWMLEKPEKRHQELSGLLNRLMEYCVGPINDRINDYDPDISISDVVSNNEFIYFHLPLSEYTRNVAVAIVEMFGIEARRRQLSGPEQYKMFPLLLDDWGDFFHNNFGPFSARCRSALMPLIFSFQSLAQIKSVSDNFARQLDDNLATKIILRVNGEDTAKFAINLLGEQASIQVGTSQLGDRDGTSIGLRNEFLITPRNLRELNPGECYISTIVRAKNKTLNPVWKLRIPRAPYTDEQLAVTSMPDPVVSKQSTGLGLWEKYMNPNATSSGEHVADVEVD